MKKAILLLPIYFLLVGGIYAQSVLGIDVSHHQGNINWTQVAAAGKVFAWVKATEGITYTDPNYTANMSNGTTAGVVMGAYHFARPLSNSAVSEANHFVSVAGAYIATGNLPPALDLEDPPGGSLTASMSSAALTTWAETWMSTVQNATGITPVIYTSSSIAAYVGSSLNIYKLWIAKPDGNPNTAPTGLGVWNPNWLVKQYSWSGTVSGISSAVDLNVFNGTINDFNTLIGGSVVPTVCNNDDICSPATLTIGSSCNNTSCSTVNANPPSTAISYTGASTCTSTYQAGRYDDDVWFSIIPVNTDPVTVTVTPTSNLANFDPAVGIYTGNCNSPTQVNCADLGSEGLSETLSFTPAAGTTYYIRVFSYGIGTAYSGDFNICAYSACTPPNTPVITGDAVFCSNTNGTISVSNTCNGCTYLWSNGQSGNSTTVTNSGTYSVTATNSCSTAVSNPFSVTKMAIVVPTVNIIVDDTSICAGEQVVFTTTMAHGGSVPGFQWYKNGSMITGANSSTYITAGINNADDIQVQMTSSENCSSPAMVFSDSVTIHVVQNVLPALTITADSGTNICAGNTASFTAAPVNGGSAPAYQWYVNSNATGTGNSFSTSTLADADTVFCVMNSSELCVTQPTAVSNMLHMRVSTADTPVVTLTGCELQAVMLPYYFYQWYYNMAAVSSANDSIFMVQQSGNYYVLAVDSNLCSAPSATVYVSYPACLPNGMEPISDFSDFNIYALGNNSWQLVAADRWIGGQAEVYNVIGEVVQKFSVLSSVTTMDSRWLAPGMYLLKITQGQLSSSSQKILKN